MQNALYHSCSLVVLNFQQSRHEVLGVAFGLICASIIDFDEPTDDWWLFQSGSFVKQISMQKQISLVYGLSWIYSNYHCLQQKHKNHKNSSM